MAKGLVSIQDVVREFISEKGDFTDVNYLRYLKMAIRGFTNLNLHTVRSFRSVILTLNDLNQAVIPDDYVNWVNIGVLYNGKLYHLNTNPDLFLLQEGDSVGVESQEIPYKGLVYGSSYVNVIYGATTSLSSPSYKVFRDEGKIQFSSNVASKDIAMEYITTGINPNGMTYIPKVAADALIEYLHWRDRKNDKKFSRGEVMDAKQDYIEAETILMDMESLPSLKDLMYSLSSGYQQTPKR